ncbi:MAG: 16S rRNA (guanine(527)-N(7))-methyltransferase RsmG [Gammaproteobacteria bacterium]|nr:16S rRNA (guanine(527)-N(7))-methyltransferase RsmG [Gammaproteobacteria bacterium]
MDAARVDEPRRIIEGAARLGVALDAAQAAQLSRLLDELARWNKTYNLTAVTARHEMLTHHLLDSLSVAPQLHGERVVDVGTGAGFPGLPLAVAQPQRRFTLLDSNGKKVRFVAHAARTLGLANVEALQARAGEWTPPQAYDTVVARAFAPLPELVAQVAALCGPDTRVLAMKGRRDPAERAGLPAGWRIEADLDLEVPGLGAERHLLVLRPPGAAPDAAAKR